MNEKNLMNSLLRWVLPLWIMVTIAFLILTLAKIGILFENDITLLITLFICGILRMFLTFSPLYLTIVSWTIGYKTTRKIVLCIIINIVLFLINFAFYLWSYGLFGRMIFWR